MLQCLLLDYTITYLGGCVKIIIPSKSPFYGKCREMNGNWRKNRYIASPGNLPFDGTKLWLILFCSVDKRV